MKRWAHPGGRLRELGAEALTDRELLAIHMRVGRPTGPSGAWCERCWPMNWSGRAGWCSPCCGGIESRRREMANGAKGIAIEHRGERAGDEER